MATYIGAETCCEKIYVFLLTHASEINWNKSNVYKNASYNRGTTYEKIIYEKREGGGAKRYVKRRITKETNISMKMHD